MKRKQAASDSRGSSKSSSSGSGSGSGASSSATTGASTLSLSASSSRVTQSLLELLGASKENPPTLGECEKLKTAVLEITQFATAEAAREAMKQLRENADNLALTIRGVYIPLNAAVSITSFLNMGSKLRVSMVCRDMHAIISSPHAWRSLEFPSWGRTRFNKASFNAVIVKPCFANVVHLTLGNMTLNKSLFPTVFSKLPLLYSLDMWSLSGTILQDTASDIVKAMKNPLGIQRLRLNCK